MSDSIELIAEKLFNADKAKVKRGRPRDIFSMEWPELSRSQQEEYRNIAVMSYQVFYSLGMLVEQQKTKAFRSAIRYKSGSGERVQ